MTHHHNHGWKHPRLGAEMRRKLTSDESPNNRESQPVPHHHHHHRHHDVHSGPGGYISDKNDVDTHTQAIPNAENDLDRRAGEVTQTVTTYVATQIDLILESGSRTIAEYTVSSLPAVITDPKLGVITIPANAGSSVTAARPLPVETDATLTGPTAMMATANHQVPLKSSSSSSDSSQTSPTQPTLSDSSSTISDLVTSVTTTATSGTVPTSISETSSSTTLSSSISTSSSTSSTSTSTSSTSSTSSTTLSSSSSSSTTSLGSGGTYGTSTSDTSSASSTAGTSSSGSSVDTPKVVGGVVGGVLGLVLILLLAFLFLRWKTRRSTGAARLRSRAVDIGGDTQGLQPRSAEMASHHSSNAPIAAAAVLGRRQTSFSGYQDENATGERGFQKISGRKIPSVLHTGGDGYGDEIEEEPIPDLRTPPLESTSPVSPTSAIHGDHYHHTPLVRIDSGDVPMMRPSPARTPTTSNVDLPSSGAGLHFGVSPSRPDSLGRSLSRYDGSRGSRFTESI